MTLWINDAGTWKEPTPSVNDAGTWKEPGSIWINDAGTWKEVYTSNPEPVSGFQRGYEDPGSTYSAGTWTDQSGNNYDLGMDSSSSQTGTTLSLVTSAANNYSGDVIDFDDTGSLLHTDNNITLFSDTFTVFFVGRAYSGTSSFDRIVGIGEPGTNESLHVDGFSFEHFSDYIISQDGNRATVFSPSLLKVSDIVILSANINFDGTTSTFRVNGIQENSFTHSSTTTINTAGFGVMELSGGQYFVGEMLALYEYPTKLSLSEVQDMEHYFDQKYGLGYGL